MSGVLVMRPMAGVVVMPMSCVTAVCGCLGFQLCVMLGVMHVWLLPDGFRQWVLVLVLVGLVVVVLMFRVTHEASLMPTLRGWGLFIL